MVFLHLSRRPSNCWHVDIFTEKPKEKEHSIVYIFWEFMHNYFSIDCTIIFAKSFDLQLDERSLNGKPNAIHFEN